LHNIPLVNGRLSEPVTEQADLYRSGEESHYTLIEGEEEFEVLQRDIALFARFPGQMTVAPANFLGQIPENVNSLFSPSRRIYRDSNSQALQVRDIPVNYSGQYWLPAKDLLISENWIQPHDDLTVGDSINRHINIVARGLPAEALPEGLLTSNTDQIQFYPDQVGRQNRFEGADLIGSLNQSFVVVFTQAGEITLPELRLSWWDLAEDVEKQVILPERRLTIIDSIAAKVNTDSELLPTANITTWLVTGLFMSMIVALYFWLNRPQSKLAIFINKTRRLSLLKKACLSGQSDLARTELLNWAATQWPDQNIVGLFQVCRKIDSADLDKEIRQLDEAIYSVHKKSWNGVRLYRLLLAEQRQATIKGFHGSSPIPPLYPQSAQSNP